MAEGEHTRKWRLAFAAIAAFAFALTVLAYVGRLPPELIEADKWIHFTVAGLLALSLDRATGARSLKWTVGLLVLFGIEEVAQRFSANRTSSVPDYAADVAGVVLFISLSRWVSKVRRAKPADDVAE